MTTLKHSIEIRASPEKVFSWLMNLDKNYRKWHPDHIKWVNEEGSLSEGKTAYYEEYIHGKPHKIRARITKLEKNRLIEFKNMFPMSLICPKGSFVIEPKGKNTLFTATLSFRGGRLLSGLMKSRLEAIKSHMREEGENLKRILEK